MALDDNRISFGVDVSTGQSEESINKVIDRIDGLKDKINELKKLRTENKQDADIFANYTKSIRDTERELSKLQSTYNSWIQKATNIDTKPIGDVKKQTQEFISLLKQWDGQSATFQKQVMSHFMIPNSAVDQLKLYKNIMGELQGYGSKKVIDTGNVETALKQLVVMAKDAQQAVDKLKASLKGTNVGSTGKLAEEEEKLSRIRQQLNSWDGKGAFSSTISGFDNLDSYSRQIQALRRAYEELNAVKGQKGIDNAQVEPAIDSVKRKYDELVAKKNQVDAELKKGIEGVAKASKKASDEESANLKKTIDEYTRLKLKMAEIQEQIKNNYVTNFKTSPALYNTNFARLSAEYKEVAEAVNQADRNMARFATKADLAGRAMDRLYQRSAWFFSAIGANAIIAVPNAWYDAQVKIENSMAQFSQVMATNSHSVNAFKTALFDMDFGKLQQGLNTTSVQSKEFNRDLEYMKNSLVNLAIKYGEVSDDVIKSATLWGRKYKDNQTVLTMTNAAMKLAVADSFSIVEANKNLESSLVQWGFQIKNNNDAMIVSNKIIDSWTALAHKMAVSAQDLSAANQRAAQSMRAVGLSFDEGQALIATMLANTQQAGGEIGNAIKSIMGSIHSKKAIEDLEAMGVAVYKFGENGKKEFREVGKVLIDLMIKTQNSKENLEKLLKDVSGGKFCHLPQPQVIEV